MVSAEYRHSVIFISLIQDRGSLRFFSDCSSWFQSNKKSVSIPNELVYNYTILQIGVAGGKVFCKET